MFESDLIFLSKDYENRNEMFEEVCNKLVDKKYVKENFYSELVEREEVFPTGLATPIGVAIPHTDGLDVLEDKICLITLKSPIEFNEMGGEADDAVDVKVVIVMAVQDGGKHLEQLQRIIQMIQDTELIDQISKATSEDKVLELIKKYI